MAKTTRGARFVLKRSSSPGASPTVPPNNDHTTGWIDTDIYVGEIFLNITDNKMWFRNDTDEMIEMVPVTSGGTIDPSYLPGNYIGAMVYQGTWDASTGNPPSTTPEKGDYWIVSVSGNTDLDGITDWQVGDFAIYNGTTWDKIDNTEPEIHASSVIYSHSYYTGLSNAEEGLDFLLDRFNYYSGGTNISITDDGSGHGKTIAVSDSPTFSGTVAAHTLTAQTGGLNVNAGGATITGLVGITGNLTMAGTGVISSPGNINTTGTGNMSANTLQARSGKIEFNAPSNYILNNGTGIKFYNANVLKLDITPSAGTTSYNKLSYDTPKVISSNQDIVDKGYVDNEIAIHNVGLWTSGGTSLNDPYKIIAWDGVNTHYVGVNVQNPTSNLHVSGSARIEGQLTSTSSIIADTYFRSSDTSAVLGTNAAGTVHLRPNGYSSSTNESTFSTSLATIGTNLSITGSITSTLNTTGTVNVGQNLTVDGAIDLGTNGTDQLILRGSYITIANTGHPTDDINLMFAGSSSFGNQTIAIQPSTSGNGRILYIKGQNITGGLGTGGNVGIYGGTSANAAGGNLTLSAGGGTTNGSIWIGASNTTSIHSNQSTFPIATPSTNELLFIDSDNQIKRGNAPATTPGGANTNIQFNNSGSFGGSANFTWNNSTRVFTIAPSNVFTQKGVGVARLGLVNAVDTGSPSDYPYCGFAWNSDSGSGYSSRGHMISMKHVHQDDNTYSYAHLLLTHTGLLVSKVNRNSSDTTAANGGTWRSYPALVSGVFTVSGEIRATGDITAYYSDIRLKKDKKEIENPLDKVLSLNGFLYKPNELVKELNPDIKDEQNIGLSAQEVQEILPEAVKPAPFDIDENGNSISGDNYLTIQYEKLVPLLVESIKELKAEIEELKKK